MSSASVDVIAPTKALVGQGDCAIEVAVHEPNRSLLREVKLFLQGCAPSPHPVFVITTCQETAMDLVEWSPRAAAEKDRLLRVFVTWATALCDEFERLGYWADYFDPCSGLLKVGSSRWSEVHAMQVLRGHRVQQAGECFITVHPRYGARVYPCSMLVTAPRDVVVRVVSKFIAGPSSRSV